jgi:hypothetical protein
MLTYLDLYTEILGQPNQVESIRFALGFANARQIGGNYCKQNAWSRINTESQALVCLNLDFVMCRINLVKRPVGKYTIFM